MSTEKTNQGKFFFKRLLILQKGISGSEFCRNVGISTPLYQKWKKGSQPKYDKLQLVSRYFKCKLEWLLGEEVPEDSMMYKIRDTLNFSHKEMGERLGITEEDVRDMETGKKIVPQQVEYHLNAFLRSHHEGSAHAPQVVCDSQSYYPTSARAYCSECADKDRLITHLQATNAQLSEALLNFSKQRRK